MSYYEYNPDNKFGFKDTLPEGHEEKIIKGSEFDDEFKKISAESQLVSEETDGLSDRLDDEIEARVEGDQNLQNQIDSLIDGSINIGPDQVEGLPEYLDENYVNKVKAEDQQIVSKFTFQGEKPTEDGSGNKFVVDPTSRTARFHSGQDMIGSDGSNPWDVQIDGSLVAYANFFPPSSMSYTPSGMSAAAEVYVTFRSADNPDNPINPDPQPAKWIVKPNLDVEGKLWVDGTDISQELLDIEAGLGAVSGQIVFGGTYDPSTGLVVKANLSGFEDGQPLPAYDTVQNKFLICTADGTNPFDLGEGDWLVAGESGWVPINYVSAPGLWTQNGSDIYYDAGNVGIGTDTVADYNQLHVQTDGIAGALVEATNAGGYAQLSVKTPEGEWVTGMRPESSGNFIIRNAAVGNHVTVTPQGKVGIGTDAPRELLHVNGATVSTPITYGSNKDGAYLIAASTSYDSGATHWGAVGFQHRIKSNSGGGARITVDTNAGEIYSMTSGGVTTFTNNVGIGMEPTTRTAKEQLAEWKSKFDARLKAEPKADKKAVTLEITDDAFEVLPTEEALAEWMETRAAGDKLQVAGNISATGKVSAGGALYSNAWRREDTNSGVAINASGALYSTVGDTDLGTTGTRFKDGFFSGTVNAGSISATGTVNAGQLTAWSAGVYRTSGSIANNGNGIYFNGEALVPANSTGAAEGSKFDIGTAGASTGKWKDAHFSGTVNANKFVGDGSQITGLPLGSYNFNGQDMWTTGGSGVRFNSSTIFPLDGNGNITSTGPDIGSSDRKFNNAYFKDYVNAQHLTAGSWTRADIDKGVFISGTGALISSGGNNDIGSSSTKFNNAYFQGAVSAGSFVKSGGTSAQLLCADGSVVAKSSVGGSSYDGSDAVKLTGDQHIAGKKEFDTTSGSGIHFRAGTTGNRAGLFSMYTGYGGEGDSFAVFKDANGDPSDIGKSYSYGIRDTHATGWFNSRTNGGFNACLGSEKVGHFVFQDRQHGLQFEARDGIQQTFIYPYRSGLKDTSKLVWLGDTGHRYGAVYGNSTNMFTVEAESLKLRDSFVLTIDDVMDAFSTLRTAVSDEDSVEGLRTAISDSIGGLLQRLQSKKVELAAEFEEKVAREAPADPEDADEETIQ